MVIAVVGVALVVSGGLDLITLAYGLAGVVLVVIGAFLWNLNRAPSLIYNEKVTALGAEVDRLNTDKAERDELWLSRQQLVEARTQLGNLMSDAGDMLISQHSNDSFLDTSSDFFSRVLDLFRSDIPAFDESHEGRFYAATTKADMDSDTNTTEGMRHVLRAQIE